MLKRSRNAALILLATCLMFASGCAMCCNTDDYTYPTYGGKWQRSDPYHGRVGSVLSDGVAPQPIKTYEELPEAPGPAETATHRR